MAWTRFMDMHSGGRTKVPPYDKILIEASEDTARQVFSNTFGRNPDNVTCNCCGSDYVVDESPTLEEATAFDRNCEIVRLNNEGDEVEGPEYPNREDYNGYADPEYSKAMDNYYAALDDLTSTYVERRTTRYDKYYRSTEEAASASPYISVEEYSKTDSVLIIYAKDIDNNLKVEDLDSLKCSID